MSIGAAAKAFRLGLDLRESLSALLDGSLITFPFPLGFPLPFPFTRPKATKAASWSWIASPMLLSSSVSPSPKSIRAFRAVASTHQFHHESRMLQGDYRRVKCAVLQCVLQSHLAVLHTVHLLHSIPLDIHHTHRSLPHRDRRCRRSCRNLYHFVILWNLHTLYQTSHTVVG